jgi:MFS superfamily sulfate permease-like transporter
VACGIIAIRLTGPDHLGLATFGTLPTGLPSLTWPSPALFGQLWPAALGIALMSFTESVAAERAFRQGKETAPSANRELFALGLANAGGAFVGAMPAGGGTTQTAVNYEAGARSQMAGLVTAAVALAALLLLAPLIGLMPDATLAAVVIVYSVGLIKPGEFSDLKVRGTEFGWALRWRA